MRKRLITPSPAIVPPPDDDCLDLDRVASVDVTSEEKDYGIEGALVSEEKRGWRAGNSGTQTIRLLFGEPQRLRRISLLFEENKLAKGFALDIPANPEGFNNWRLQRYNENKILVSKCITD